jgi:hypothetical protein
MTAEARYLQGVRLGTERLKHEIAVPVNRAPSGKTNAIIAMVVALLIVFIALHLAGIFGP